MFCGIDPGGLEGLAAAVELRTDRVRHEARIAISLLDRNQKGAEAGAIASAVSRIENWSLDTSSTLRWRADTILSGQDIGVDTFLLGRARFAAEAVFSIHGVDKAYQQWVQDMRATQRRVDEAVTNISGWLSQSWVDWDVTNSDLHDIRRTLAGLPGEELDMVIAALSPRQLQRWIEEMGNAINGFSQSEKQAVFSLLAANASGQSLGKIHHAILRGGGSEEAIDLGVAIRQHASDRAIVDFVRYAVHRDLAAVAYSTVAPVLAAAGVEDRTAIGTAVRLILADDETLRLIVVDSLVAMATAGSGVLDTSPFGSLVDGIARTGDAGLKADTFAAMVAMATETDTRLRKLLRSRHLIVDSVTTDFFTGQDADKSATEVLRTAEAELLAGATTILVADANGVVQELANRVDPTGQLTTSYYYALVDHGRVEDLTQTVDSLRGVGNVDPTTFSTAGADPNYQYPRAQNLGFVAGILSRALEEYAADASSQIDWINRGARITTTAIGLGSIRALESLEILAVALEGAVEWVGSEYWPSKTQAEIVHNLEDLSETVVSRLRPLSQEGSADLEAALHLWQVRYDLVRDR